MTAARVTRGAISLSSSSHFPAKPNSEVTNPVVLPPGRCQTRDQAAADRIGDTRKHDRHAAGRLLQRAHSRVAQSQDDVRR